METCGNDDSDGNDDDVGDGIAPVDHVSVRSDATGTSSGADDALRHSPMTIHLVENRAQRIQCVALGGYPPPSVDVHVGRRDVTDQLVFRHSATLTGATLGMRRIDFRSERSTDRFLAQADDDGESLRCEVVVPGEERAVELVRLDVDCESMLNIFDKVNK